MYIDLLKRNADDPKIWNQLGSKPEEFLWDNHGTEENVASALLSDRGVEVIFGRKENILYVSAIIFMHSRFDETGNTKSFIGNLPFDLNFDMSMENVVSILGQPAKEGGGQYDPLFGKIPDWKNFELQDCYLHTEFDKTGLNSITLTYLD